MIWSHCDCRCVTTDTTPSAKAPPAQFKWLKRQPKFPIKPTFLKIYTNLWHWAATSCMRRRPPGGPSALTHHSHHPPPFFSSTCRWRRLIPLLLSCPLRIRGAFPIFRSISYDFVVCWRREQDASSPAVCMAWLALGGGHIVREWRNRHGNRRRRRRRRPGLWRRAVFFFLYSGEATRCFILFSFR